MPSAKPDKALIKAAVRVRYGWEYPADIFKPIQDAALLAIADGGITPAGAAQLELSLLAYPKYDFFPYNVLQRALANALQPSGWEPVAERDLLIFITAIFGGDAWEGHRTLANEDLPSLGPMYPQFFDTVPADFSLTGKLCNFTGAFEGRSRRECFEQLISSGATPSDGGWYTDCFFVADDHYHSLAISSSLQTALACRAQFGMTRIYRESAFTAAASQTRM